MTRIFEIGSEEFARIQVGDQMFITLKDDKVGVKAGDKLILQDVTEDGLTVNELPVSIEFTYYEGLKQGWVTCAIKERE